MDPLDAIIIVTLAQIIGYITLDRFRSSKWKTLLLGIILILNLFVLPSYFFPDNHGQGPMCGMPMLAVTLLFWVLGNFAALTAHLFYLAITRHLKKKA